MQVEYFETTGFMESVRDLQGKGMYRNAVQEVQALRSRIYDQYKEQEVFKGLSVTHHGESRLPHCVKYDLQGRARLVVVRNNGVCILLFVGTHSDVDRWLDRNKGLDFIATDKSGGVTLTPVRTSGAAIGRVAVAGVDVDVTPGPLIGRLSQRHRVRLLEQLPPDLVSEIETLDAMATDETLMDVACQCESSAQADLIFDVLQYLRAGDTNGARHRIAVYGDESPRLEKLAPEDVEKLVSGETTTRVSDVDPTLFKHFVETASFEKWMLFLHPAQREYVEKDYGGPARLSGVSGSGKTCVLVHRALRLADKYPDEKVLVLTLSAPLATLINRLIDAARGEHRPSNIEVSSVWELCYERLLKLEPHKRDWYTQRTIAKNPFAQSEHVDEIWREYFECENNNRDADVMFDVIKTLALRGVYARDYLRQEFDYIRSTLSPRERQQYTTMERTGRIVHLTDQFREAILRGLVGWERKMEWVGVIDELGIVAALYAHLPSLMQEYRCVLVDEVQDLGTLELAIIRKLAKEGENDIFLCGDSAQTIHTKHADLKTAGISITGRAHRLNQNYRNSRQILEAAHGVLTRSMDQIPKGAADVDILAPEFANFSSSRPVLMQERSVQSELANALVWLRQTVEEGAPHHRGCLAVCGYSLSGVEALGAQLGLPVLAKGVDVATGRIFISDLEQTKGFEFDTVVIANCSTGAIPHPDLPPAESFRDLCRLYVAMTRAKTQLLLTYSGELSPFVQAAREAFIETNFAEQGVESAEGADLDLPAPAVPARRNVDVWGRKGRDFLRSRDAVGMEEIVQTALLRIVTGNERTRGKQQKQLEWKTFGGFVQAMKDPQTRFNVLSDEAWNFLSKHVDRVAR
jgi:hypothetical protein